MSEPAKPYDFEADLVPRSRPLEQLCPDGHVWPYERFVDERDTNAFMGEFEPETIADKLEEYRKLSTDEIGEQLRKVQRAN